MYMMKEIKDPSRVEEYLSKALKEKRKIMGFGHRVYKNGDARVPAMYECAQQIAKETNNTQWMENVFQPLKNIYERTKKT